MPRVTITVSGKNAQPYRFQLEREVVTLGRGSENDIAIDCGSISVKHAEMWRIKGGYELRDVGSTNGIKLNDQRQELIPLYSGMTVALGDVAFEFELSDEELEVLARENPEANPPVQIDSDSAHIPLPPLNDDVATSNQGDPVDAGEGFGGMNGRGASGGLAMGSLFFVLAMGAFVAGMAIRFQKDTGDSWLDAVLSRGAVVETSAEEAAPETPAED